MSIDEPIFDIIKGVMMIWSLVILFLAMIILFHYVKYEIVFAYPFDSYCAGWCWSKTFIYPDNYWYLE